MNDADCPSIRVERAISRAQGLVEHLSCHTLGERQAEILREIRTNLAEAREEFHNTLNKHREEIK